MTFYRNRFESLPEPVRVVPDSASSDPAAARIDPISEQLVSNPERLDPISERVEAVPAPLEPISPQLVPISPDLVPISSPLDAIPAAGHANPEKLAPIPGSGRTSAGAPALTLDAAPGALLCPVVSASYESGEEDRRSDPPETPRSHPDPPGRVQALPSRENWTGGGLRPVVLDEVGDDPGSDFETIAFTVNDAGFRTKWARAKLRT
jgi:hypothetical protein